eukprot:scaffold1318_cov388-Prasinococcus_capsulatus_cf.AAC.87
MDREQRLQMMDREMQVLKTEVEQEKQLRADAEHSEEDMLAAAEIVKRVRSAVADASTTVAAAEASREMHLRDIPERQPVQRPVLSDLLVRKLRSGPNNEVAPGANDESSGEAGSHANGSVVAQQTFDGPLVKADNGTQRDSEGLLEEDEMATLSQATAELRDQSLTAEREGVAANKQFEVEEEGLLATSQANEPVRVQHGATEVDPQGDGCDSHQQGDKTEVTADASARGGTGTRADPALIVQNTEEVAEGQSRKLNNQLFSSDRHVAWIQQASVISKLRKQLVRQQLEVADDKRLIAKLRTELQMTNSLLEREKDHSRRLQDIIFSKSKP